VTPERDGALRRAVWRRSDGGVVGGEFFRGFVRMVLGVQVMGMSQLRVVRGGFVVAVLGMRRGFVVVMCRLLVMRGGVAVMLVCGCFGHLYSPELGFAFSA
jgi:hypothetical protein